MNLGDFITDVPDFPEPGIIFKDITPLLDDAAALQHCIAGMAEPHRGAVDKVVGIESRGFIFGAPVATALGVGFVPLRKAGKLPRETVAHTYDLEYGSATLELHADAFVDGERVLVIDDVLATGGTAAAAIDLVRRAGGDPVAASFLIALSFLDGAAALAPTPHSALITY